MVPKVPTMAGMCNQIPQGQSPSFRQCAEGKGRGHTGASVIHCTGGRGCEKLQPAQIRAQRLGVALGLLDLTQPQITGCASYDQAGVAFLLAVACFCCCSWRAGMGRPLRRPCLSTEGASGQGWAQAGPGQALHTVTALCSQ
ncbi:hypothetical protein MHYP_G00038080 [Metynnis hypsauchen]